MRSSCRTNGRATHSGSGGGSAADGAHSDTWHCARTPALTRDRAWTAAFVRSAFARAASVKAAGTSGATGRSAKKSSPGTAGGARRILITGASRRSSNATGSGSETTRSGCGRSATRLGVAGVRGSPVPRSPRWVRQRSTSRFFDLIPARTYCGGQAGEIDHIQAVSAGGGHVWHNMTSACRRCNATKHDASLLTALLRVY